MPLYVPCPVNKPEYHNQKELADVSDEEFHEIFQPKKPNTFSKIYRAITFVLFLGPIRLVLTVLFTVLYFLFTALLSHTERFFDSKQKFRNFVFKTAHPFQRIAMFFAGVVKVNINGKIDPRTRSLITNHLSLFDAPMICSIHPLCFVLMESLRSVWLLRKFGDVYGFIYVDRSVKCNTTEKIINTQNDPESPPLQVFPEGKVTNGDCIMGFRTGAFVNDTVIQPVTMRYNQYLIREDMATVSWLEDSILTYLYQYFSIPFMTLNINILDPIDFKGSKKTPQERAAEVQLIMANSLGCKAIKRTNKEIFQKPKAE